MSGHIDYQRDWSGECRTDPDDGNAYVLRSVVDDDGFDYHAVNINDIFGGHERTIALAEWLKWELA